MAENLGQTKQFGDKITQKTFQLAFTTSLIYLEFFKSLSTYIKTLLTWTVSEKVRKKPKHSTRQEADKRFQKNSMYQTMTHLPQAIDLITVSKYPNIAT